MFCSKCGKEIEDGASFCPNCGNTIDETNTVSEAQAAPHMDYRSNGQFNTGMQFNYNSLLQQQQPVYQPPIQPEKSKSKVAAGLLAIFLGSLGIHKFYLGYTKSAVIMLLITLLTAGFGGAVMAIISLVEGIIYLTKSDEEFNQVYVYNQKQWF